jgi:uncharacterized membrane protein
MRKELKIPQIDKDVEVIIGNLLRIGVILSASFVFIGGVFYLWKYGNSMPNYKIFKGEPAALKSFTKIFQDALSMNRRGIIQFGLIILIATPLARVIFSMAAFLYEKDYMYVGFTLIVLTILLYSIFS